MTGDVIAVVEGIADVFEIRSTVPKRPAVLDFRQEII
jgi:hypothetical protein